MNRYSRRAIAFLFTSLILLSGCLGGPGDTDGSGDAGIIPTAQGSETTVVNGNYLPMVEGEQMGSTTANVSWAWENETTTVTTTSANGTTTNTTETTSSFYNGTLLGMNVTLYHSAMDPDGGPLAMGWDMNLDGIVDIPVSANSGFTTMHVALTQWHSIPSTDLKITTAAFIATDSMGDRGVAMIDIYSTTPQGPWSQEERNLALYAFSGKDAQGTPGAGTDDNLIMVTMDQGGDINWASISVKLSVDGAAPVTCDNPGGSGGVCGLVEFGTTDDQVWSVGDGVTIVETGTDVCGGDCTIDVTITDTREGKTIDTTNGVPAE